MQLEAYEMMLWYAAPAIFVGIIIGYILGGRSSFSELDRIATGAIISVVGGLVTTFIIASYAPVDGGMSALLYGIAGFAGGCVFGQLVSWQPYYKRDEKKIRMIFEPEDDDEYDREIEDALGGKQ